MSVICGYLTLDHNRSPVDMGDQMIKHLNHIPVDKVESWHDNHAFFSCHHQFITAESTNEILPYYDREAGIVIVANAIVDNRKELFQTFNIPANEWGDYTDSQLILLAYKKWREDCSKHLLGDFTYVIYEEKTNKTVCARDHTGRSLLYYTKNDSYFAFCTLIKPLVHISNDKVLDEQWLADFLSIPTVIHQLDTSLTAYRAVKQLQPAHTLVLHDNKLKSIKYWDPVQSPKIRYKQDAEYDESLREVLTEAVKCKLRSIGNIGISMSGGLDSSTIGCIAAGLLKLEDKKLKSYTSIPMEGYVELFGGNSISDESSYVNEIIKMYPNIEPTFCRCEGKNSYSDMEKHLNLVEHPYKTVENLFWLEDIYRQARNDRCKVLLDGQFGNQTISFGDYFAYFNTLLYSGRLIKLANEIKMYSRHYSVSRKKTIKKLITGLMPILKKANKNNDLDRFHRSFSLVDPAFSLKNNEAARLDDTRYGEKDPRSYTINGYKRYLNKHPILSQVAVFENKLNISYGVIGRDPTKDKRVIEFCFGLPGEQYFRNGRNKVILRRSMKGIIPDKIRLNYYKMGIQSADWIQRLVPLWDDISRLVRETVSEISVSKYVNTTDVLKFLDYNRTLSLNINSVDLRQIMAALIFGKFILANEEGG